MKLSLPFSKNIISMDIGAYEIKLIEGNKRKDKVNIIKYFTIPTPKESYYDGEIMDKELLHYTIKEGLKEKGIKAKNAYLTINNSSIITREVNIPKVRNEEIEDILNFQLKDYMPVDIEKYIVQFKVVEDFKEDDMEKLRILLVAIPKEMVEEHFELLGDLDLNPIILDYQPNAIAKLIQYSGLINNEHSTADITFAIIDMGYSSIKVFIVENGRIQVSRIIELGDKDVASNIEDSKLMESFFNSLNQKIDLVFRYFLSRKMGNRIDRILLLGGNSNINGMEDLFSHNFNIPSVKIRSLEKIEMDEVHMYANAIGAIIRGIEV